MGCDRSLTGVCHSAAERQESGTKETSAMVEVEVTMTGSPEVLTLLRRTNQSSLSDQSCIVRTRVNSFLELVEVLRTIVPILGG